jgi:hypothetical protein
LVIGDEIETDADCTLNRIVARSGQCTFRVWFEVPPGTPERELFLAELDGLAPLMEWSSENLLALSALEGEDAQSLVNYLLAGENAGFLKYETGRL